MRFSDFVCEPRFDTVTITDKDGTRLGLFDGKINSDDDWVTKEMFSNSDMVEVQFHTDGGSHRMGWRLDWSEYEVSMAILSVFHLYWLVVCRVLIKLNMLKLLNIELKRVTHCLQVL